jgi:hypothetical protein
MVRFLQSVSNASLGRMDEPAVDSVSAEAVRIAAPDLPARSTLELAEELARRFKVDEGIGIVELTFQRGRFEHAWLKRRVQKAQLADADEPSRQTER